MVIETGYVYTKAIRKGEKFYLYGGMTLNDTMDYCHLLVLSARKAKMFNTLEECVKDPESNLMIKKVILEDEDGNRTSCDLSNENIHFSGLKFKVEISDPALVNLDSNKK